ncbi:hypothetical protein LP7551_01973 [Roseibium album]|nr:hypothetical protein LP7551_01973 [Roseibium album]
MSYDQFIGLILFLGGGVACLVCVAFIPGSIGKLLGLACLVAMWAVAFKKIMN